MVGFRVIDVGLLVAWMYWFFRLRDDGGDAPEDENGGGGGNTRPRRPFKGPGGGGGLRLPLGRWPAADARPRDGHPGSRRRPARRGTPPLPSPTPARVRSPGAPARVTRRS
jgi:hypothetical protein